jgi:magnesium-transporting ATPase (P-type)
MGPFNETHQYRSKKGVIKMKTLQKFGGFAALIGAATNLFALVTLLTLLEPKGYGSDDPGQVVAFLADNQAFMRAWYVIIYLVFGVSMVFLSLALYERLKAGSPARAQAVTTFGLIYAVLVIVIGALSINNLSTVVELYGKNPAEAATVWLTLDSVETGLGAGGGETIVTALWFLLLSWAALRARELPRVLNYLGVVLGVAGILSVVLASLGLSAVYGLGLIIWFVWLGIVLLRRSPVSAV